MLDEFVQTVSQVGFPIFVALWLLVERKDMKEVIKQNNVMLGEVKQILEKYKK